MKFLGNLGPLCKALITVVEINGDKDLCKVIKSNDNDKLDKPSPVLDHCEECCSCADTVSSADESFNEDNNRITKNTISTQTSDGFLDSRK